MTPEQMDKIRFRRGMKFIDREGVIRRIDGCDFEEHGLYDEQWDAYLIEGVQRILNPDGTEVEV